MSLKKIKNYFDPRENLILNRKDEDEDEITFEEARDIGAQRVRTERSGMNATPSTEKQYTGTQTASMPLMTELQKNNLSFDDARQLGMQNHALDYQREIRERALKMMKDAGNKKSPYEALSQEDKSSLDRLYSLKNQLQTFSIYNQTNPQGGNPLLQTQNPYNTDIQQEYNKLYADLNKKGYDVTELIRYYERVKNGEAAEDIKKTLTEKTADHPALMSAASVGLNLLTAQNSFPKAMKDAVYDAAYGTDLGVDTNAPEFFGTYTTNAIREKASTDIIEKTREKYGDGAAWAANLLYGTGMSMADSLTANALGGFSHIGSVIQGINAANSSLIDVSERGVSAGKTLLTAAAAGIFEGLFEDWSLGNLKAMQPEMNSTLKAVGKNVLKQMGVEGSEEAATEIANLTFDTLLNGDKSSIASKRTSYINQGMSKAEATGQVIWDAVRQVAEAGLGGALSGIGFGAGGSVTNYAGYNHQVRQIGSEALQSGQYGAQLRNALQFDPSSPIGQAAIKMVNRDKISNKAAGRFVTQYDRAASEAIQGASNEQEVRDAYRKFSSNEDPHGAIVLSKMADERTRALAAQKVDGERAQEQQNNETSETAVQSTAIEGQAAPRVATSAHETQTRSESNRTTGEYFKRDGTAWRGESGQHDTSEAVSGEDIEIRYATTHLAKLSNTGEQVAVMDVANTDGDMEVLLSNGRTAKLGDLQFDKNEDQILYSMAKQFPTAKARAFVNNYNGSISPENYTRAFNVLYEAGYQGKTSLVKAMQRVAGIPRERKAMLSFLYLAGENRAAAEAKAKQERQPVARGSGRFVNKTGKKLDEAMQLLYMGTAAKTGMTIELRNQIQKDANGAFDAGLSRILLSQSADNQIATLVHETAEYVREYNLEGMLDVQEAMLGWYAKVCNFETLAAMVEDYRNRYEGQLGEESVGEAMGELTNDAMSALFADEAGAQDFLNWLKEDSGKTATQQKNILQTIVELFDRLIEKISEYLHGHSLPKAANVFAEGMDLEQMAALRQMFFEAADQARKNYDAVEKRTNKKRKPSQETAQSRAQAEEFAEVETGGENQKPVITESGEEVPAERIERREAKYALNPNFERQYDQWDKKNHRMHFNVGTTSEALKSIGVKDTNIEWDSSKIIKIKEKHPEMTDRVIKQVPYVLEHPMLIMQSLQKDSRLTMFGEVYGENGKPVLAIIELYPTSGKGFKMDSMKLVSAYGKDNAQSLIDRSRILYVEPDKKRANRWLLQNRLQLPLSITNYGSIGRIARTDENVNNAASTSNSIRSQYWFEEANRYVKNLAEIDSTVEDDGEERYNQSKGADMHDEETGVRDHAHGNVRRGQRGDVPSASSEKSEIKPHVRSDPSIRRIGTEPGGGEKGVYGGQRSVSNITGLSPKRTSPELKKIEKGSSEYNDTPERTKYSLKRSMGGTGVYMDDLSYRRYPSDNPMSNWGHAMFSDDPYRIEQYGNHLFGVFLTDLVDVEDLKSQIAEAWEKSLASPFSMIHNDSYWEQFSGTEIAENFDPADIVESAEAWDNPELVRWFFEECDFWEGLQGIKTRDGAIVWDQDIIHEGDPDPDNGVTGEDIVNKITKYSFREPTENTPEYAELLSKWGSIKPGYKPFREIKVPKKTSDEKKVRRFVRSVMESNAVTDEMAEDLKGEIVKEAMSYTPISDKQAQDTAKKLLKSGVDKAWRRWNAIVDGDSMPQKSDIALGEYLLRLAAENGDKSEVVRLTAEISELGTRAGQNVQALSMLKKMTGIGQLVYVQRTADTLNKDLIRRFKGKAFTEVKINEKLAEDLVNAKTPEEVDAAAMEIYKDVADQLPPTWIDKWNAWRYLSMLGNTKTHIRNILGNAVFAPVVRLKDAIGAGIEAASIKSGERTKAVTVKQEYKEFAKQDFDQMQDVIKSGGKMNPTDVIRDQRTIFKTRWLETLRKKNFEFMEIEDGWFLKAHYESALAQYLQANKTDLSKMTEGQLERARNYAIQEAQRATFRDASPVASAIQRASNTNKALNVIVEGILPFKKTPVNVLKRGVEYSPAGLLYTLSRGSMQLKRGEITASQYIDGLASGLTGTGLTALGALLCGLGWVSGGFGDDKEDKFAKLQGRQEYALRIGDFTYTIDWMAPSAIPFFIGVELMAALQGEYEDAPIRAVIDAIANIMEPMFNLSMLDSLNNTINAVSFADNKLTAMIQEVITSYFMQAIPALSGHIARTVDPTRRRTYIDKNSWIPESMQRTYQKLFNKIPGLSYLNQPYIDEWGREDKTQNIVVGAFENFLSPGWFSEIRTSDMEQELLRLYEATGESGVLPGYAAKFITVDGEKINFTGDEYTQFSEIRGQTAYSTISEIMSSEEYESMSDAQKVKAVKDAFEFAGSAAKAAVSEYELEGWQQDANDESQEEGTSIGESIAHRAATNGAAPEIASTLEEEGAQAAQERIDLMMEACKSRDEMRAQKGNVKSAITRAYKNQYIKCYEARDAAGMREIRQQLMELRTPVGKLYTMKDFRNWIDN